MDIRIYVGNLNKSTTQDEINTLYSARYWAGIDCSGLVQRSVNSADKLTVLGAKSSVLELSTGSCDANAESCPACNEVGSQTFIPKYASRIYDSNPKTTTIKERAKALSKVRKGDLAVYKKHVALVHSNELTCGGITKDKNGKDKIDCTYDVIHAYGLDYGKAKGWKLQAGCIF